MKRIFLLCFAFLLSVSAWAQIDTTKQDKPASTNVTKWTLRQCVDYMLNNNLNVERGKYNVESSRISYLQAVAAMLPNLNAGTSLNYAWGRSLNQVTYQYTTQQNYSINPSLNSSVTLFNGFRLYNNVKQTSTDFDATKFDLEKIKNDATLSLINLYITVIFNRELLENGKRQLNSTQQQLDRVKKQVDAGSLPMSNQLDLDAQLATNELNVINLENNLNLSLLQLKQAMLIDASQPFDIESPEVTIEDLILDQSKDEIYNIAYQAMPEIKSADLRVKSSYYGVRAARGSLFPRLTFGVGVNSQYSSVSDRARFIPDGGFVDVSQPIGTVTVSGTPYTVFSPVVSTPTGTTEAGYGKWDQLQDNIFKSAGFTLSIPIFNNFQTGGALARAKINNRLAEITKKETQLTLRQNIETAYNQAVASSKAYNSSLRQVQAREESFRITKQRFDNGAANSVDYQIAENNLFQAQSDLTRAKYDFIFRKKVLDFYQGETLGL